MKIITFILTFSFLILTNSLFGQKQELMPVDEIREVIKLAIDLPQLQQYYHVEADSTKIPLIIQEFGLINSQNMQGIEKFGKNIVILTEQELKTQNIKAYLSIGDWTYGGKSLRLQMAYSIEGLTINYRLVKEDGRWRIANSILWED